MALSCDKYGVTMKTSELITKLQVAVDEYGDLEIGIHNQEFSSFDDITKAGKCTAEMSSESWFESDSELLGD